MATTSVSKWSNSHFSSILLPIHRQLSTFAKKTQNNPIIFVKTIYKNRGASLLECPVYWSVQSTGVEGRLAHMISFGAPTGMCQSNINFVLRKNRLANSIVNNNKLNAKKTLPLKCIGIFDDLVFHCELSLIYLVNKNIYFSKCDSYRKETATWPAYDTLSSGIHKWAKFQLDRISESGLNLAKISPQKN